MLRCLSRYETLYIHLLIPANKWIFKFFMCPVIILGGCFFVLFFVPFAVGRSWMPDKHGCVGLSDSYKMREVGWCQNLEIFLIIVLLIIYSLLLLFQTFCWLASPTPNTPQPFGFLTPSVDLWTLTWWFVICAVVIYPSYFGIFICSPQVTFVANVTRIPQNLLVVAINWFFSIFTFVDQYIYSYVRVCVRALN